MGAFYGTGIEIWAGFGPVGVTKKKDLGRLWSNLIEKNHIIWGNLDKLVQFSNLIKLSTCCTN